jgi:hypothetical protein
MRYGLRFSVGLACICAIAASGDALAKSRRHHHHHGYSYQEGLYASERQPLVLERRSFLDPGTRVPVGSTNRYVLEQTYYNQDPVQANQRSWYMNETLPQRLPQNVIVPYEQGLPF